MNRKVFLRNSVQTSLGALLIGNSLKGCGFGNSHWLSKSKSGYEGRVLVLIQLDGGNDGLNTIIPIDQYANLTTCRGSILIPEKKILSLNNSSVTGLHPALGELQKLYNDKQLTVIQGVGYSNPDLSHFKAIDIWNTGSDTSSSVAVQTGWLGRFLDQDMAKNAGGDPPAIQTSSALSKALQGHSENTGVAVETTTSFADLECGNYDHNPGIAPGKQLSFVRKMVAESKDYLLKVKAVVQGQKNLSTRYPASGANPLADQLKIVAQLIGGGLQTKVYLTTLGGFDTHVQQVDHKDTTKGDHAMLLAKLSEAIAAFQDDITLMGKQDQVMGMTFSEFGRRIKSNASYGCDHGTAAPIIFFGTKLKGGLIGNNPEIPATVKVGDNLPLQNDFRSVYASVLKGWFGLSEAEVNSTVLGSFPAFDLFKA